MSQNLLRTLEKKKKGEENSKKKYPDGWPVCNDITHGCAPLNPIAAFNTLDDEDYPDNFKYSDETSTMLVRGSSMLKQQCVGCSCEGFCSYRSCECVTAATYPPHQPGTDGRITSLVRQTETDERDGQSLPLIVECGVLCACNQRHCGNRVVENRKHVKLVLEKVGCTLPPGCLVQARR